MAFGCETRQFCCEGGYISSPQQHKGVIDIPVLSNVIAIISSSRKTGRFSFPLPLRSTVSFLTVPAAGEFFGAGSLRATRAVDICAEGAVIADPPLNTEVTFAGVDEILIAGQTSTVN